MPRSALIELPGAILGVFAQKPTIGPLTSSLTFVRVTALQHTNGYGLLNVAAPDVLTVECLWKDHTTQLKAEQVVTDAGWARAYMLCAMRAEAEARTNERLRARPASAETDCCGGCGGGAPEPRQKLSGWAELAQRWEWSHSAIHQSVTDSFNVSHELLLSAEPFRVLANRRRLQVAWLLTILVLLFAAFTVVLYSLAPCEESQSDAANTTGVGNSTNSTASLSGEEEAISGEEEAYWRPYVIVETTESMFDTTNATGANVTASASTAGLCVRNSSVWWSEVMPRWALSIVVEMAVEVIVIFCKVVAATWSKDLGDESTFVLNLLDVGF